MDNEWVIDKLVGDIGRMGCDRAGETVVIRGDNAPAIDGIIRAAKAKLQAISILEYSPPYSHQSNGNVERGVQAVEDEVRVLRLALQEICKQKCRSPTRS